MKKINISWYTDQLNHKASFRIRINILHKTILTHPKFSKKYNSKVYSGKNDIKKIDEKTDVLIIQKAINLIILNFIKNNFKNKLIIFDINDPIFAKNISLFKKIISFVDIIIVDTQKRKEYMNNISPNSLFYVIPDTIDYSPIKFIPPTNYNNIVWFGNRRSFRHIKWYLPFFKNNKYKFNIITALPLFKNEKKSYKKILNNENIKLILWKEKTFIYHLRKNGICILSHNKYNAKSNNKMITAITHGIPCIIHKSTAYEELLKQTNLENFIVNDYDSLEKKIKYLNNYKNKEKYLKKIQEYVWKNYNNITITKKLLNIIQKHL